MPSEDLILLFVAGTNKPKSLYIVVLGLAGAGLGFDKFVLGANADTVASDPALIAELGTSSVPVEANQGASEPLGERFILAKSLLSFPEYRRLDAFSRPAVIVVEDEVQAAAADTATGRFLNSHHLTAVLSQPSGDLAVVDGRLLRVGDTVDGMVLTVVEPDGAVFETDSETVRLVLARPELDR